MLVRATSRNAAGLRAMTVLGIICCGAAVRMLWSNVCETTDHTNDIALTLLPADGNTAYSKHGPLGPGHPSVEFTLAAAKTEPKNVSRHDTHPMINESAATPDHILRTTGPAFNSTIAQVR